MRMRVLMDPTRQITLNFTEVFRMYGILVNICVMAWTDLD